MRFFNHCTRCDARIPWRKRAYYGNSYKPVICQECSDKSSISLYGSLAAAQAAMQQAIREEEARA